MIDQIGVKPEVPQVTDGDIAVLNLKSATRASWSRFWRDPHRPGVAELIVEQEQLAAQFLGDLGALDRLETLGEPTCHGGRGIGCEPQSSVPISRR